VGECNWIVVWRFPSLTPPSLFACCRRHHRRASPLPCSDMWHCSPSWNLWSLSALAGKHTRLGARMNYLRNSRFIPKRRCQIAGLHIRKEQDWKKTYISFTLVYVSIMSNYLFLVSFGGSFSLGDPESFSRLWYLNSFFSCSLFRFRFEDSSNTKPSPQEDYF